MFALLIKPAAMKKAAHRKVISDLKDSGAIFLTGHDAVSIRSEIESIKVMHSDLTVVACGGDGTVNLCLNSIVDLNVKFAVLPMGTGNDFARYLGLKDLDDALLVLTAGLSSKVDVGKVTLADGSVKYFGAVASCGFDAQVNEIANQMSGPNGPIKYLAAVFREISNLTSLHLSIKTTDQNLVGDYTLIAIGNTSSYGGGMYITPAADLTDGKFTVTYVTKVKRRTLLKVLPKVFSGNHVFHPKVAVDETDRIEISGDPFPVYADGERLGLGPAKFEVLPARLEVLTTESIYS
ncbi:MAG: hypothetical protein RL355_274 [Actinomycetota bacterium]|jgi:diacylglycerol kinase (ATP)